MKMLKNICKALNANWVEIICRSIKSIDQVYIKSFLIIFVVLNIAFAFHTINFMFGHHDFTRLIVPWRFFSSLFEGRATAFLFSSLLTNNNVLPVFSNLWAFLLFALSAVGLCVYWRVPKSVFSYSIIGILLTIQPYTLAVLYCIFTVISFISAIVLVIFGFLLSTKASESKKLKQKITYTLTSLLLFLLSLSVYPSIINTIFVVFIGRLIVDLFLDWKGSFISLKDIIKRNCILTVSLVVTGVIHLFFINILKNFNLIINRYNTEMISYNDLYTHLFIAIKTTFQYFWNYPVNFFSKYLNLLFAMVFIFAIFIIIYNILSNKEISYSKRLFKSVVFILLSLLLIAFSNVAAIISSTLQEVYEPRVLFY
jgi:hypothetical protein